MGQASSFGSGASVAQAYGSTSDGAELARDGYFPESAYGAAKAVANSLSAGYGHAQSSANSYGAGSAAANANVNSAAHNGGYYPVPAPATVITYEQNFAPTTSESHTDGDATSSASTRAVGGYGATSSNAYSHRTGSADSKASSGYGGISSFARTQGDGSAASSAQNSGVNDVVYPAAPAVFDAKSPIYYTSYVPVAPAQAVASSHVVGSGHADSSAKTGYGQGRTISWRFGTLYDAPASAQAQASTGSGYGSAKSVANSLSAGHGHAQSSANSYGAGSAAANANVNSAGYGGARSTADALSHGSSNAAAYAKTQGLNTAYSQVHGSAQANAQAV